MQTNCVWNNPHYIHRPT